MDEKKKKEKVKMIQLLHEYNEMKDVGIQLLSLLSNIEGKTMKELYEEYGVKDGEGA